MIRSCIPIATGAAALLPTLFFGGKAVSDFSRPAPNAGSKAGDAAQGTAWALSALGTGVVGVGMTYGAFKLSNALSGDKTTKTGEDSEKKSIGERIMARGKALLAEKPSPRSERGSEEGEFVADEATRLRSNSHSSHGGPTAREEPDWHSHLPESYPDELYSDDEHAASEVASSRCSTPTSETSERPRSHPKMVVR
jgi:hypothetical protein